MIDISDALRWLNHFDQSHLNETNQRLFSAARSQRTANAAVQDLLRAALQQARTSPRDALDYAETLLNCGEIEFRRGFLEPARDHLASGISKYVQARDVHGSAVACWMFGIAQLALPDTDASYRSWKRSLKTVNKFRMINIHFPTTRDWYTSIFIKMNQDLVALPQEAFTWINLFSASHLIPFNRNLVELIDQNIRNGNWDEADRIITLLKERTQTSPDLLECAEIFAETGLARFRMREWPLSIGDLRTAMKKYPAESHQRGCVRWMLGAVQYWFDHQKEEAMRNWDASLEGFKKLARKADQNNHGTQKRWYRDRIVFMSGALKGKIAGSERGDAMGSHSRDR